jgi:hypothetical protein
MASSKRVADDRLKPGKIELTLQRTQHEGLTGQDRIAAGCKPANMDARIANLVDDKRRPSIRTRLLVRAALAAEESLGERSPPVRESRRGRLEVLD